MNYLRLIIITGLSIAFQACISTEEYNRTVSYFEDQEIQMTGQIDSLAKLSDSLTLHIARQEGENKALLEVQDRLQDRLDLLQEQMDNLDSEASTNVENLSQQIQSREAAIAMKEQEIQEIRSLIVDHQHIMDPMYTQLSDSLESSVSEKIIEIQNLGTQISIVLPTVNLFTSSRSFPLTEQGVSIVSTIAQVLNTHPDKYMSIIGHTDNSKPNTRYFKDNWDYGALQANALVRYFVQELNVSSNQIMASSKGEYAPRSSNSTQDGKKANKRIELLITVNDKVLLKKLEAKLPKSK